MTFTETVTAHADVTPSTFWDEAAQDWSQLCAEYWDLGETEMSDFYWDLAESASWLSWTLPHLNVSTAA